MSTSPPVFTRRSLLALTWPLLVVTLFALLGALGNQVLLLMQSDALNAAISNANRIFGVANDVAVLFGFGSLVVVAQLLGAGAIPAAQRASIIAFRASTLLGLALGVVAALGAPLFLDWLRADPAVRPDAQAYIWVAAAGVAFYAYQMVAYSVLRAFGRTIDLLIPAILINVIDLTLLYTFLFVLDLGVIGSALPTLIVRASVVVLLAWLVRRVARIGIFTPLPPREAGARSWTMARLSVPTVIENSVFNVAVLVGASAVNALGRDATNAQSFALTLTALVTGVTLAFSQGNETIVGWDVGDRDVAHARRQTRATLIITVTASVVLAVALWLGGPTLLPLVGLNAAAVALGTQGLAVSIVLLPLAAITTILYGALRSAGDVTAPMAYSIATSVVVLAPPPSSSPRPSAGASRARSGRWHWPKRSRRSCWAGGGGAVGGRNSPASSTTPTARHPTPPRGHDHPPGAGDDHRAGRPLARRGRRALGAGRRVLDDAASAPAIAARAGHAGAGGRTGAGPRRPTRAWPHHFPVLHGGGRRRGSGAHPRDVAPGLAGGLHRPGDVAFDDPRGAHLPMRPEFLSSTNAW